jgi:hypothetical protein
MVASVLWKFNFLSAMKLTHRLHERRERSKVVSDVRRELIAAHYDFNATAAIHDEIERQSLVRANHI